MMICLHGISVVAHGSCMHDRGRHMICLPDSALLQVCMHPPSSDRFSGSYMTAINKKGCLAELN
jgi:hypothetical protein